MPQKKETRKMPLPGRAPKAIHYLDAKEIPCVKMDATPQGKPIYARLGFRVEYEIERHSLTREPDSKAAPVPAPSENIEAVMEMNLELFVAVRSAILRSVVPS